MSLEDFEKNDPFSDLYQGDDTTGEDKSAPRSTLGEVMEEDYAETLDDTGERYVSPEEIAARKKKKRIVLYVVLGIIGLVLAIALAVVLYNVTHTARMSAVTMQAKESFVCYQNETGEYLPENSMIAVANNDTAYRFYYQSNALMPLSDDVVRPSRWAADPDLYTVIASSEADRDQTAWLLAKVCLLEGGSWNYSLQSYMGYDTWQYKSTNTRCVFHIQYWDIPQEAIIILGCNNYHTHTFDEGVCTICGVCQYDNSYNIDIDTTNLSSFKIGLICLHDKSSTYDKNFIQSMEELQVELGLRNDQLIIATGVSEGMECYEKACEMAEMGCNVIVADSFGHEDYMIMAAKRFPDVLFGHASGVLAHTEGLPNYVNGYASIYDGRYLTGVAAGLKLQEMIDHGATINGTKVTAQNAKVGFVGAYTYAEVISAYTAFYLGVRSIVPTASMEVTFVGSWYDETAEKNAAEQLISRGCVLLSQYSDSWGVPNACERYGVPNVCYNVSTAVACPETYLTGCRINWAPFYRYLIACKLKNIIPDNDYIGSLSDGAVELFELGNCAAAYTGSTLQKTATNLRNGALHVFDIYTFTVEGQRLDSYYADVDVDDAFMGETQVISNGYFHESTYRSAPYFDLTIDGITLLNTHF